MTETAEMDTPVGGEAPGGRKKGKAPPKPKKNKGGRPTKYVPAYAKIAAQMCKLGATDADLAAAFGVTTVTIWNWQSRYPEFFNALRVGKGKPDDKVERSLYQRAVGYSYSTEKIFHHQGTITRAQCIEHVPPDPGAAKIWLTNRRSEQWRDKSTTELTGKDGAPLVPVLNVKISRAES
jgi:hypothetical protein